MAGLLDLLNSDLGKTIISGVGSQVGADDSKTGDVLSMAMPLILGAMKKNVKSEDGAAGLLSALSGKHDGSILDNLGGLFQGGVDNDVLEDGAGILGHVFGNKQEAVENTLSAKSGLNTGQIGSILKVAAPILMGLLGKETRKTGVSDSSGLNGLLGGLLGGQPKQSQSLIESLLDADGDGSVLDDVAGMVMGAATGKKGGLGGLLGGLFKR